MGETVSIRIHRREDSSYEVEIKENWSRRTVRGPFFPPYTARQITALQKKLDSLDSRDQQLRDIGCHLFSALCGAQRIGETTCDVPVIRSVQSLLQEIIQRTLKRRGTVALSLIFEQGCEEFIRYPWELLHDGNRFLLVSGIFTLTRALLRSDTPMGCELPVRPPFRVLYVGSSPSNCPLLETERSFDAMERGLAPLCENGQVLLDRLEPPTFGEFVRYLNLYGGASIFDDNRTELPCYVVHFDGHGAHGRLCPADDCKTMNLPDARRCSACGTALGHIQAQTYLSFCDESGCNSFIDTQSLRNVLLSSDVRLAVFSACETATLTKQGVHQQRSAVDATLATALVTGQVPAVVAMPFSLQDDLSPTFMYHFYEALANGRTLEEALARSRQAMLPMQQRSWFIPVLYRQIEEGDEGPVALIAASDEDEHAHPLAYLSPPTLFVGREKQLHELDALLNPSSGGSQDYSYHDRNSQQNHAHIILTGPAGIGKSALAYEAVRRNRGKFQGGIVGVSFQNGKSLHDVLLEIMQRLHISVNNVLLADEKYRLSVVVSAFRSLANRELPCLLLLDGLDEIKDKIELAALLRFLGSLPSETTILVTSRSNPANSAFVDGLRLSWYEYQIEKMTDGDLFQLFKELAGSSGLDQRIRLDNAKQQAVLQELCTLLDGYPLGAELIFGTAHSIGGYLYTPEAATRSLEEIRDDLRSTPLAGIHAVLSVAYYRLTPPARLLLSCLAAFRLPFGHEQINILLTSETFSLAYEAGHGTQPLDDNTTPTAYMQHWRSIRDELVQTSFIQFDGSVYSIHSQIRRFAFSCLPPAERSRIHRMIAAYYVHRSSGSIDDWIEAFEHLEATGETQDLRQAIQVAIEASIQLEGHAGLISLQSMLTRAVMYAQRLSDADSEAQARQRLELVSRSLS